MSPKIKNSLLSLFALFLVAIGFQNMSWLATPSPEAKYFPKSVTATTPEGVGREVLKHNLAPIEQVLKERFEVWTHNNSIRLSSDRDLAAEYSGSLGDDDKKASWALGLTSAANYRVAYRGAVDLTCDVSTSDRSYKVSVKRSISSTSDLRLEHDSRQRDSSLKMQINW